MKEPSLVYKLNVNISEAKDLSSTSDISSSDLNTYVVLNLDSSKKKTRTIKGVNPLWAENYTLQLINPAFSKLLVSVWNEGNKDKIHSMCEIPLNNLAYNTQTESWYELNYCTELSYVSGEIRIRVDFPNPTEPNQFSLTVVEGRNLFLRTRSPQEFFVKISMGKQSHKTKSFKIQDQSINGNQSNNAYPLDPEWNESFLLQLPEDSTSSSIHFSVYRAKLTSQRFVGQFTLPISDFIESRYYDGWHLLENSQENLDKEKKKTKKMGSIRLSLKLTRAIVYPIECYTPLINFLMDEKYASGSVSVLEKTIQLSEDRNGLATCLVRIYESKNKAPMILKILLSHEINNAENTETLFRANSLASKSVDMYMKLSCFHYLQYCVKDLIDTIFKDTMKGKSCDIDSIKLEKNDDIKKNWKYTRKILEDLLDRIYHSADKCPPDLRDIFYHIQNEVQKKFPNERTVKFTGVSGFLFLRFICPAILGPKLFDMASDHPPPKVASNLTQIAKILQRIANMGPTSSNSDDPIIDERENFIEMNKQSMKSFLNIISNQKAQTNFFNPASIDLQQELSFMQEHCEKNIDKIMEVMDNPNEKDCEIARELLCILDTLNDQFGKRRPPCLIKNENGDWIKNPDFHPIKFDEEFDAIKDSHGKSESLSSLNINKVRKGSFSDMNDRPLSPDTVKGKAAKLLFDSDESLESSGSPSFKKKRTFSENNPNLKKIEKKISFIGRKKTN